MKLCFIDDKESITKLFSSLGKMKGHEVTVSNDGRKGLALLESQIFDVTVLDIAMPGFSGIDVVDALQKSRRINVQKIIILTASAITRDEEKSLINKGVKMCLKKPMPMNEIMSNIESVAKQS